MARGRQDKHEAKRSAAEDKRQEQHAREARPGERANYLKVKPGSANYKDPVEDHMRRLGGRSMAELMPDHERGAVSPLERRKRR
jgi:hypothetical protein